ncbi:hypothetical protein KFZ70_03930 [Tamlana fucoidanivorans]|uniref:NlpE C-terminal OB domain-containing protein n=1 Tax=Allotamlana fucoidanivorans TaxID=2583814 RepID=A0A5C4SJS4_9FLAO|nr:hypothetical protein [Tamlana fucoidanivorans]TNJ44157.1 hypothetical protein FGF67_08990 [Tamlana fucoidanivorans]
MKKVILITFISLLFMSCKNESKSTDAKLIEEQVIAEKNAPQIIKGEFVYFDGAAVLQTHNEIYGVLVTDKMLELNEQAKTLKTEPTDMVLVEIKGHITNKKDEKILWENKIEVVEIISVKPAPKEENIVKL